MPKNNTQFLLDLKIKIEKDEKNLIRIEEKDKLLNEKLVNEFNCSSIQEAEKKLGETKLNWENKERELTNLIEQLEK